MPNIGCSGVWLDLRIFNVDCLLSRRLVGSVIVPVFAKPTEPGVRRLATESSRVKNEHAV